MKFTCLVYPLVRLCAVIISLAPAAMAEEHPDDLPATITVKPASRRIDGDNSAAASVPQATSPKLSESEPGALPTTGYPGARLNGPPGAPPRDGPPPMAVGELHVGALARVDLTILGSEYDDAFSTTLAGLGIAGRVHENVKLVTALLGRYDDRDPSGTVSVLDTIIQYEPTPEFNVWLGRMVEAVDRSSLSGPWFVSPWYLTGIGYADGQVALPKTGPLGRSNGATVWGQFFGGHLKYYAAAFDLVNPAESPMFTGRLNLALLTPEPGYNNFSGYFGRDLLAIGAGAQSKKGGSVNLMTREASDYTEYNVDLLFETNLALLS